MPAPDPLPRPELSTARLRTLQVVARLQRDEGVPIDVVAGEVGGHPNTSRQQLDALAGLGLLEVGTREQSGRGRRPRVYRLTEAGRQTLAASTQETWVDLVAAVASHADEQGNAAEQARSIGATWGRRRAETAASDEPRKAPDARRALGATLSELGFDPHDEGERITLRACPFKELADRDPTFICALHEGMLSGMLDAMGSSIDIRLLPMAADGECWVHVSDG